MEKSVRDLKCISILLSDNSITHWLMSGTLLGCIKTQSILPDDRDIDIGLWLESFDVILNMEPKLKKLGFRVEKRYDPVKGRIKKLVTLRRSGMPIDLKFFEKKNNYAVRYLHRNKTYTSTFLWRLINLIWTCDPNFERSYSKKKHLVSIISTALPSRLRSLVLKVLSKIWLVIPGSVFGIVIFETKYFDNLVGYNFYGSTFSIPKYYEDYLLREYGQDWEEHDPDGPGGLEKPSHIVISGNR